MLSFRRAQERLHERRRTHEAWSTFHAAARADELTGSLHALEVLREGRLLPQAATPESRGQREIVTYVREGAVTFEDSNGRAGVIQAGEFMRMTTSQKIHYRETNASPTAPAHLFQLSLRLAGEPTEASHEIERFTRAQRRGRLCVVASPDGRSGSLRFHQDATLYSAILEPGRHVIHALTGERSAWLHLIHGALTIHDVAMQAGDGVGLIDEPSLSVSIREPSELLLLELGPAAGDPAEGDGAPF